MADILKAYTALSASSPRSDITKVLNGIIHGLSIFYDRISDMLKQSTAPPFSLEPSSRRELIKDILDDLKSCGTKGRLISKSKISLHSEHLSYVLTCCRCWVGFVGCKSPW